MRTPIVCRATWGTLALAILVAAGACAPVNAPTQPDRSAASEPAAAAPKTVTIGMQREVEFLVPGMGGRDGTDTAAVRPISHETLVAQDETGRWAPRLAPDVISLETGTWQTNADGTMDTTWRLRPDLRWHDGTPFTADDLLFAFEVYKDPEITTPDGQAKRLMESSAAPEPRTVVIHWSEVYVSANRAQNLIPLPRHLLEEPFRTNREAFFNNPQHERTRLFLSQILR